MIRTKLIIGGDVVVDTTNGYFSVTREPSNAPPNPFIDEELWPLYQLHLSNLDTGVPMHAVDNGAFWTSGCHETFRALFEGYRCPDQHVSECNRLLGTLWRISKDEVDAFIASAHDLVMIEARAKQDAHNVKEFMRWAMRAAVATKCAELRRQWRWEASMGHMFIARLIERHKKDDT